MKKEDANLWLSMDEKRKVKKRKEKKENKQEKEEERDRWQTQGDGGF